MANVVETVFRGVDEISGNVASMNASISRLGTLAVGVTRLLGGLFGVAGLAQMTRQFVASSDAMQEMNEVIAQFRDTQEDVLRTQENLARISIATDTQYAKTFELYARLGLESEKLGLSENERLKIVEAINQAQQLAGPLARDVGAAFQRILQTGEVSGQTLIRTLGGAPRLLQAVADEFDVTTTELKRLAEEGRLTADRVLGAVVNQSEEIRADFEKTGQTVGESITNLGTAFGQLITKVDEAIGGTDFIASRLQGLAEIIADLARTTTPADVANDALVAKGAEIERMLAAEASLLDKINNATREVYRGRARVIEDVAPDDPSLEPLRQALEAVRGKTGELRAEFDALQAAYDKLAKAALDADNAVGGGGATIDIYAGKAGDLIKQLEEMAATVGMTEDEIVIYKLEQLQANDAQLAAARSALAQKDAYDRLQESIIATADAFTLAPDQEGPVRETALGLEELTNMTQAQLQQLGVVNTKAAEETSTAWDEATRNIQDVFADFIFDPFEEGVKGMVKGFADAVKRMIANAIAAQLVDALFGKDSWLGTILSAGFGAKTGGPKAAGGWTTPGALHPINEQEPEFLLTAGRDRVVPLSKMAANGLGGAGRSVVYAPQHTTHVQTVMNALEMEQMLRRRDEQTLARWRELERDGVFS